MHAHAHCRLNEVQAMPSAKKYRRRKTTMTVAGVPLEIAIDPAAAPGRGLTAALVALLDSLTTRPGPGSPRKKQRGRSSPDKRPRLRKLPAAS
jgi:hypothetical protein